jgi:hypothetical protein
MIRCDVKSFACVVVRGDDSAICGPVSSQVHVPASKSPDWAVDRVSITFLVDTDAFLPIFLVVELHGSALGRENEIHGGVTREAA